MTDTNRKHPDRPSFPFSTRAPRGSRTYEVTVNISSKGHISLPHQCDDWWIGGIAEAESLRSALGRAIAWLRDEEEAT